MTGNPQRRRSDDSRNHQSGASGLSRDLRITEIYPALMGESEWTGRPGLIIRLTGCNLRCAWCDSSFAFSGGRKRTVAEVIAAAKKTWLPRVLVTGGEPLLQAAAPALLAGLVEAGFAVMLETNGSLDLSAVPPGVHLVMDLKAPLSGSCGQNRLENLALLEDSDEIKIVIAGREDYLWARKTIRKFNLDGRFKVSLSPAAGLIDPADLAGWMLADRLDVRLGLQLHKVLFGDRRRT